MRTFTDGNGNDSTAAATAYLIAHRQALLPDIYVINSAPNYAGQPLGKTLLLTSYPSPLVWNYRGTFLPTNLSRAGVESKIGTEVQTVNVTWSPREAESAWPLLTQSGQTVLTVLDAFQYDIFDNGTVEIWKACMLPSGDCNTYGAALMFAGRIGEIKVDRLQVSLSVISRMEALNVQVPCNLIEPTNANSLYEVPALAPNGPALFTVAAGSTATKILATPNSPPAGYAPYNEMYNGGLVVMKSGLLGGAYRAIQDMELSAGDHAFYVLPPLPIAPSAGDTLTAYVATPRDNSGSAYQGFPWVTDPISLPTAL